MGFSVYGEFPDIWEIAVLAKARFSGPPKMAIFRTPKIGYFGDHQKRPFFRVRQKGAVFEARKKAVF